MIARIAGTVIDTKERTVVIEVHGIGYQIFVPKTYHLAPNEACALRTHLSVRENALDLYGFLTEAELMMFELLLTLPKIGPKSALQILDTASVELLHHAVATQDAVYLAKMSGVTKKNAEKIVMGLKDKVDGFSTTASPQTSGTDTDLVDALVGLGYSQKDARDALQKIDPTITGTNARITEALRMLSA